MIWLDSRHPGVVTWGLLWKDLQQIALFVILETLLITAGTFIDSSNTAVTTDILGIRETRTQRGRNHGGWRDSSVSTQRTAERQLRVSRISYSRGQRMSTGIRGTPTRGGLNER